MGTSFIQIYDLQGQTALVTGGAQGIGLAVSSLLASQGARIVIVDKNDQVDAIAGALGNGSFGLSLDVTDGEAIASGVSAILARTGKIDILVNNVGIAPIAPAAELTVAQWDATQNINLRAAFLFSQAVGRQMTAQGRGRIVSLASQAGMVALEGHVAYMASKAGLIGMSKVLALEWGPFGVTSNTISPTVVNTAMGREVWAGERGEAFRAKIPTRRFAEPEEIAHAVLYLVSGAAGMINGENLVVDGGYTIA